MLSQCNLFARVYCPAYVILSNPESFNSEGRPSNDGSAESDSPYIIVSSSMRIRLIEGGNRRAHNLPAVEDVVAIIVVRCGIAM